MTQNRWWVSRRVACASLSVVAMAGLAACNPALNWRTVRLGDDLSLQFPCKPDRFERQVAVLDQLVAAQMLVCESEGMTWSATRYEWRDAARSRDALRELRHKLLLNMKAAEDEVRPAEALGMSPNDQARRSRLQGTRPDGRTALARSLFAAHGTQLYQLVVIAEADMASPLDALTGEFFDALRWGARGP